MDRTSKHFCTRSRRIKAWLADSLGHCWQIEISEFSPPGQRLTTQKWLIAQPEETKWRTSLNHRKAPIWRGDGKNTLTFFSHQNSTQSTCSPLNRWTLQCHCRGTHTTIHTQSTNTLTPTHHNTKHICVAEGAQCAFSHCALTKRARQQYS